jgi:branched-chain amino acid transport system substrate-binding protein
MKTARTILSIVTATALLAATTGLVACGPKEEETIKIGAILPLTGDAAAYGKWIQEGLELGVADINEEGGIDGKKLEIIYEDDAADPTTAVNAISKLIKVDKVPIVFGSWVSSCVLSIAPIANMNHTVVMAEAMSPKIRDTGDYIFRIQPDARYYIEQLVLFAYNELGIRTVSVLYVNNDFGVDQADVFTKEFEALGGKILSSQGFDEGETDFRSEIVKIFKENPDAVFFPAYTEIGEGLIQMREIGLDESSIVLASALFENPIIIDTAGRAAEGVIYPYHFDSLSDDPKVVEYQKKYNDTYGRDSEGYAALAYDGIHVIAQVMNEYGTTGDEIKDGLYEVTDFPGVTGPTTFDDYGDVIKPILIKTVKDGRFVKFGLLNNKDVDI